MKAKKSGDRHPLLLYRRTIDRIWKSSLALSIVFGIVVWFDLIYEVSIFGFSSKLWLFAVCVLALGISIFGFLARRFAYVKVFSSYFKVATPFLRFRISFRRMRSVYPVLVQQLFPKDESKWSERNFLEPFYGKTALVMELKGYPVNPVLLRLFLPAQMFSPRTTGFVLIVPDWMKLSTELDSFHGTWLQREGIRRREAHLKT
jgi:hypothetical protein